MLRRYVLLSIYLLVVPASCLARSVEADRISGAIMGAALGDAFARVTTPLDTTEEMKLIYGDEGITSVSKLAKGDWIVDANNVRKAPYASNTVLSSLMLDALADSRQREDHKEVMASNVAEGLLRVFGEDHQTWDPQFDARYHTSDNLVHGEGLVDRAEKKKKDNEWWAKEPQSDVPGSDSGALMRAWPVGVVFSDHMSSARYYTDYLTTITHQDPTARAAASALVTGVAHALQGASVDDVVQHMVKAAEKFDRLERLEKKQARKIWSRRHFKAELVAQDQMLTSDMIRFAVRAAQEGITPEEFLGTNNKKQDNNRSYRGHLLGYQADEAVAAAVYLLVRNPEDFTALVSEGSLAPGNAALITSLAGALYGARKGLSGLHKQKYKEDIDVLENKEVLLELSSKVHESLQKPGRFRRSTGTDRDFEENIEAYHKKKTSFFKKLLIFGAVIGAGYLVKEYVWPKVRPWFK